MYSVTSIDNGKSNVKTEKFYKNEVLARKATPAEHCTW